jgi:hypothetical protein
MSTIAQLVADITAAPAPVLFLDTCAILDVARAPARAQANSVPAAETLVRLAGQSPPVAYLLVADIVAKEWADNVDSAVEELTKALATYEHVAQVIVTTGGTTPVAGPPILSRIPADLKASSDSLRLACRAIDRDTGAMSAALDRVVSKRRPSHKKEVKDSYILEHSLAVARGLGGTAFARWLVFVSSNTRDFADPASPSVHPELAGDFNAAGLRYSVTVGSAVAALQAAGQI